MEICVFLILTHVPSVVRVYKDSKIQYTFMHIYVYIYVT